MHDLAASLITLSNLAKAIKVETMHIPSLVSGVQEVQIGINAIQGQHEGILSLDFVSGAESDLRYSGKNTKNRRLAFPFELQ